MSCDLTGQPAGSRRMLVTIHHHLDRNSGAPGTTMAFADAAAAAGFVVELLSHDSLPRLLQGRIALLSFPLLVLWRAIRGSRLGDGKRIAFDWVDASAGDAWLLGLIPEALRPPMSFRSHGLEHVEHDNLMKQLARRQATVSWRYYCFRGSIHLRLIASQMCRSRFCWLLNRREVAKAQQLGVPPGAARLVPNGVDLGVPQRIAHDVPAPDSPATIAFIGAWISRKGIAELTEALVAVMASHPPTRALLLGTQKSPDEVLADFPPALRPRIRVLPRFDRADLADLLRGVALGVLPSRCEGFGIAALDMMAQGVPTIVSDACGVADHLNPGHEVLVTPACDANHLQAAMLDLLHDGSKRSRIALAGAAATARFAKPDVFDNQIALVASSLALQVPISRLCEVRMP